MVIFNKYFLKLGLKGNQSTFFILYDVDKDYVTDMDISAH